MKNLKEELQILAKDNNEHTRELFEMYLETVELLREAANKGAFEVELSLEIEYEGLEFITNKLINQGLVISYTPIKTHQGYYLTVYWD